jgi:adenosylcobinamide-GDP ribazoletransferase
VDLTGLTAVRGAVGFLSRIPVGHDGDAWEAFGATPVAFPLAGWLLGLPFALPLVLPVPPAVAAFLFVVTIYALTGVTHADGVTDLGDAAAVHGSPAERRAVMRDTEIGTGGALTLGVTLIGLAAAGFTIAEMPARTAAALVLAAEVGAKLGMGTQVCLGTATHEGLASTMTTQAEPQDVAVLFAVAVPAGLLAWPEFGVTVAALAAAVLTTLAMLRWAREQLGGVSGDVFGATNEFARLAALHTGVIVWTLS